MINYTDSGHGKTVILIHGFCESLNLWKNLESQLNQFSRVICIDLPGYGDSICQEPEKISMEWYAEAVMKLADSLSLSTFSVVGHSLGGYVTLALAEKYPERIDSFVMFHSTAFSDSEEKKTNRDKMTGFIERNGLETFMSSFVSPLFAEVNRKKYETEINNLTKDGARSQEEAVISTIKAMRDRPNRTAVLESFQKPILWIVGEEDVAVPLKDSLKQIELGDRTQSLVLNNCGHMGMIEKPVTTTARIVEFLS